VTADIIADHTCESQPSNISCDDHLPKMRIVNIKSAKGTVGLVSGNTSFQAVIGSRLHCKRIKTTPLAKPPPMAPPPPPRGHVQKHCKGQDKMNQQARHTVRKDLRYKRYKKCNSLPSSKCDLKDDLSSAWHFGRRVWSWMHDGITSNGWIELCENGYLCTNLCSSGEGSWKRQQDSDNVLVTFGKCCHVLELQITRQGNIPVENGFEPTFIVRKRTMVNGEPLRDKRPCRTRGRLLDIP